MLHLAGPAINSSARLGQELRMGGGLCTHFGLKNTYIEDGGSKYFRVFGLHTNAIYESGFVLSSACCCRKEFVTRGTRQI